MKTFLQLFEAVHNAHIGTGGIQGWSAGELYPWTVKVVEKPERGLKGVTVEMPTGRVVWCVPFNGETGEEGPPVYAGYAKGNLRYRDDAFISGHRQAEDWIRKNAAEPSDAEDKKAAEKKRTPPLTAGSLLSWPRAKRDSTPM